MKTSRIFSFLIAGLIGLGAGVPMQASADDTEIYTGSGIEGVKPNVLFILDTSGSMSSFDGTGQSRMNRMKDALINMLDNVDNVNIGLMRFTDPGGPILFPVSAIDANATKITNAGQPDITVPVLFDEDDGEQLLSSGVVKLDSFDLNLFDTPAFGTEISTLKQVRQDEDDAEQSLLFYNNSSTNLEMVSNSAGIRTDGFRFENFDPDTDGATVLSAELILTPKTNKSGALDAKVFGLYRKDMDSFKGGGRSPSCPSHSKNDTYCRLGLDTGAEQAAGINFGNVANYSHTLPGTGNITDAIITWLSVPETVAKETITSPDIGPVLQEIFNHPGWQGTGGDDDLGIFLTGTTTSLRDIYSHDSSSTRAAQLRVDYAPAGQPSGRQLVALRFRDVRLPKDAVINAASLQVFAAGESADPLVVNIYAEKVASAPAFTAGTSDKFSSRLASNKTAAVKWTIPVSETWTRGQQVKTADISAVIKEIADQPGWCGGNDLVIFLEYNSGTSTTRRIFSREGDTTKAASLLIDFDESNFAPGSGCTTEDITRQIKTDRDDALELVSNGAVFLSPTFVSTPSHFGTDVLAGLIFREMPINPGSIVESASVEFTSFLNSTAANAASTTIYAENDDAILAFDSSLNNIKNRTLGANAVGTTVPTTMPAVTTPLDGKISTADITPLVQAIVNRSDWDNGDDIGLIFKGGSGQITAFSHDGDPSKSPVLKARIRYNVGDVLTSGGTTNFVTVRERLKEIVNGLTPNGYTPIVDTLYEASQYYRGKQVLYGATRGTSFTSVKQSTRVSHPASYESPPGSVNNPAGCSDDNLSSSNCIGQKIDGSPNYISPIEQSCQANFIVLLTDGFANHNHSTSLVKSLTGKSSCDSKFSDGSSVSSGESCGVDLVEYLRNKNLDQPKDLNPNVAGVNTVSTYTIGFNISAQFLKDMATAGDGAFFEAQSSQQLTTVFKAILTDVLNQATSFAAPSLSVNAFNRLEDRNEVYFSLFEPSEKEHWLGNVKKYQLCQSETEACATSPGKVGDVLDATLTKALGDDSRILDTAQSFWTGQADGSDVTKGGAGVHVPVHTARRVFTLSEKNLPGTKSYFVPGANPQLFEDLGASVNELIDTNGDGIIDNLPGNAADREAQSRNLLGMGSETLAELNQQIDWIRGKDVDSLFPDAEFGANRYTFSDPLHGNPLAITFGGTEASPIVKLILGTNDGGIRMINSTTGEEEWIFYPPSLLPLQKVLRANPTSPTSGRSYGVDGTAVPWIRDTNEAGVIEPTKGDFVRVFVGQRRGGNNLYALDVTPTQKLTTADANKLDAVSPKIMWRIRGGTPEFPRLGETWSKPLLTSMLVGTTNLGEAVRKTVLIFAGGYEKDSQDGGVFNPANNVGNAIYIVDAESGERLFYISNVGVAEHGGAATDGKVVTDMIYPIPSDVAAFDSDGDNATDRIYVGDTGGQMWRFDLEPNRDTGVAGMKARAGILAKVSKTNAPADKRKFFYPPSIIQVRGTGSQSNQDYDLISVATGDRATPLSTAVLDRFYAFRDFSIAGLGPNDTNNDGLDDNYTPIPQDYDGNPTGTPAVPAVTAGNMLDFTTVNGPSELAVPADFTTSDGYYIRLEFGGAGTGEKGLAGPTTLAGKLFFSTFLPQGVVSGETCTLTEGLGILYGIDAVTGAAIYNWDQNNTSGTLGHKDRNFVLGSGIPSNPVPIFFPEKVMLLVGIGGGATAVDPGINIPRGRSYWFTQQN